MAKEILVLAEHLDGALADITGEMIGLGRRIADDQHVPLSVAIVGSGAKQMASSVKGADAVVVVEQGIPTVPTPDVLTDILVALIAQRQTSLVLIGGTNLSVGVGAKLSHRTKMPFVNFCKELKTSSEARQAIAQLFGGKINAEVPLPPGAGIVGVCPGCFPSGAGDGPAVPSVEEVVVPVSDRGVTFRKFLRPDLGDTDITKQDVLVSVGRGIENKDNLALADELAQLLGGVVCGSRPVIDQGWLPLNRQVGKSGMIVKPKLYLSLGISGAPEHVEGIKGSGLVISINKDPAAPIFEVSHYGACADLLDILPPLIEKIKKQKGG